MKTYLMTLAILLLAAALFVRLYGPQLHDAKGTLPEAIAILQSGRGLHRYPIQWERQLKGGLIQARATARVLVLGNSRCQTIRAEALARPWTEVVNAGVSAGMLPEMVAYWQIWKGTGRPADLVVVVPGMRMFDQADAPTFDDLLPASESLELQREYQRFLHRRSRLTFAALSVLWEAASSWRETRDLLSLSALSIAVRHWRSPVAGLDQGIEAPVQEHQIRVTDQILPDGSRIFLEDAARSSEAVIQRLAESEATGGLVEGGHGLIPPAEGDLLLRLLQDMQAHGARRVLVLTPPYHPIVYQRAGRVIDSYDAQVRHIAAEAGVTFRSASDPHVAGCVAAEFYDGHHPGPTCMHKVLQMLLPGPPG